MLFFWLVFLALNLYFGIESARKESPFAIVNFLVAAWCGYNLILLAK